MEDVTKHCQFGLIYLLPSLCTYRRNFECAIFCRYIFLKYIFSVMVKISLQMELEFHHILQQGTEQLSAIQMKTVKSGKIHQQKNVIIYIILPFQNLSIHLFQSKYQHQSMILIYDIKQWKLILNFYFVFWKFLIFESLKLNFLFLHPIIYNPSMQLFPYKRKMH